MKQLSFSSILVSMLLGAPVAADEHHHHVEKRAVVTQYIYQTILVDQFGQPFTETGTDYATEDATSTPAATSAPETSTEVTTSAPATTPETPSEAPSQVQITASQPATEKQTSNGLLGDLSHNQTPEDFQDGVVPCSQFPAGNGVISLDWLGNGGWSGIQFANGDDTSTGTECVEGAYCSYSCQPGMSKTQWPTTQPDNGVSVGGLVCKNGFLYKTNPNFNALCTWGVDSAVLKSELSQDVAICRTDYPGTENMVIPTLLKAGQETPLTVVAEDSYYKWRGGLTSAQYYVNNAGVSVEDGCVWGTDGSGLGNWAPLNFGAGETNGISWLALIPNPNNRSPANFNVKIVGTDGSNVNGECVYENGKFNGGDSGCTVAVTQGQAQFVFYN